MNWSRCFSVFILLAASHSLAQAQFVDDFESNDLGAISDGFWIDYGGTLPPEVSDDQAFSGTQSLKLTTNPIEPNPGGIQGYGSDIFTDFDSPIESGVWEFKYQQFVPVDFDGVNFNAFSEQEVGTGNFDFGAQLVVDGSAEFNVFVYQNQDGFATLPLIRDRWVEVNLAIDLDNDQVDITYDSQEIYSGEWDPDGENDSPVTFGGINMWAQNGTGTSSIYFDDFSLSSEADDMACDFTGNGTCNDRDLDLLLDALGTENAQFKLTSDDPLVSLADRDAWLEQASALDPDATYVLGDANFDGVVDALDLNSLGQKWLSTDNPGWSDGDFDGNDIIDPADLNVMGKNWLHGIAAASPAAVPEPAAAHLLSLASMVLLALGRRFR